MNRKAVAALVLAAGAVAGCGADRAVANKTSSAPSPISGVQQAGTIYPDLAVGPVRDFQVVQEEGERRLRYSFVIVNASPISSRAKRCV